MVLHLMGSKLPELGKIHNLASHNNKNIDRF